MKKIILILSLTLIATGFAACQTKEVPSEITTESAVVESSQVDTAHAESSNLPPTNEEAIPEVSGGPIPLTDPLLVADAAMYRGTVTEMREEEGVPILVIAQAEGTVFGPAAIEVNILESTRTNFPLDRLLVGDYIEVYFGGWLISEGMEAADAIAINHLGTAAMRIYNGEVESIQSSDKDSNIGSILMHSFGGDDQFVFHFDKKGHTNFYMDFDSIKPGTKLTIYHEMAVANSLPPQTTAIEVRPFQTLED